MNKIQKYIVTEADVFKILNDNFISLFQIGHLAIANYGPIHTGYLGRLAIANYGPTPYRKRGINWIEQTFNNLNWL